MSKTIAVIGGTGMLGRPVARRLQADGYRVRIVTRDRAKARALFDDTFEFADGDAMDHRFLGEALDGCDGVHINLPPEAEQPVAEAVAQVAARHGVGRITYISGATVGEVNRWFPLVNQKYLAEKAIIASGIPSTIFCPTWFMETLSQFVVQGRASVLGKQPCAYHWIAADDYAGMVSTAFGLGGAASQRIIVHGPEAISMHEALRRYCVVFHPEIEQVSSMPIWLVRALATLTRDRELKAAGELLAYFDRVGEGSHQATVDSTFGAPPTTLDMWLESRARLAQAGAVADALFAGVSTT